MPKILAVVCFALVALASEAQEHACERCHALGGKPGRLPIPFDPFDERARERWAKSVSVEERQAWAAKLDLFVFELKKMPPVGSYEAKTFKREHKASLALKQFLTGAKK